MTPAAPAWLDPLRNAVSTIRPEQLSRYLPPPEGGRDSAVLILLGEGPQGPDVLLVQRADALRSHPGQPAFPGGAADPGDGGPTGTALREAAEEVGVLVAGVTVLAELPQLYLPPSGFVVTPVLAWWHEPSVVVVDPQETETAHRVPIAELVDPANRYSWRHPSGFVGPAFDVRGMLVWGFTAGLLDGVLTLGGWTRPWDDGDVRDLPPRVVALLGGPR
ncbi:MAG: CoA pyrophosphatase [Geodermatophilaceae bacterium]|nr:CoA pyrophosphatase [Geodermatophilaceae bacterium]MDQ3453903.1 CoA pyrophosphatase [Actinomycetota bacterium]